VSPEPSEPDNLTRIEGIGPKISSLLQAAGITTFAGLAEADVSQLTQILTEADLASLADPSTWSEQARLAAAGDWDALEALQEALKGGRRA
jgi:predicted flap endonuclease-1-like 5' DNA nuclease